MSEIGVIGRPQFTTGFELVGVRKVFETENSADLEKAMADADIGVLIVEDSLLAGMHPEDRRKVEDSVSPVIVSLSKEASSQSMRQNIIRAIGADLL